MSEHKRLKIGLIVPGFSVSEEDWCIPALLDLVRELASEHDVHVFTLRYPHQKRIYRVYGATIHALGGATTGGFGRIKLLGQALYSVVGEARRKPFDILHGLWADEPGFIAVMAGRLLGVSAVVSLLGGELVNLPEIRYGHQLSRSARWMISHSLEAARFVTVGSELLARRVRQPTTVIPLGVDIEMFKGEKKATLTGKFKLLHVASLSPIKNQEMLLRAISTIPEIQLHILGDGGLRSDLEQLAKTLNIPVTFHGEISHDHLPEYYRAADLCVITSHYESQSMVALEAGVCGKMTVGTRVGILPELVGSEFLVEPGDVDGLTQVIQRLMEDKDLKEHLSRNVYQKVVEHYSLQRSVERWMALYLEAVGV